MGDASSCKLWSEGPQICNIDPKVMPYFSFHAKCNYCGEMIPFTSEVEREMRKHYNSKHRLYCNACKKGDFSTREELDNHLSAVHKDGICFKCHTSFKLASALAMHVEGPRNECAVPHEALVAALRSVHQNLHNGVIDPSRVYSPISCCSGNDHTVQKLKEFRKTLLLAHEKAYFAAEEKVTQELLVEQNSEVLESLTPNFTATSGDRICEMKRVITNSSNRDEWSSLIPMQWTCSTCVDANFTCNVKAIHLFQLGCLRLVRTKHCPDADSSLLEVDRNLLEPLNY